VEENEIKRLFDKILEELDKIKEKQNNMYTEIQLAIAKAGNHDNRLELLEKSNYVTIQNCASNIPKITDTINRINIMEEDHKKIKLNIMVGLITIIGGVITAIIGVLKR